MAKGRQPGPRAAPRALPRLIDLLAFKQFNLPFASDEIGMTGIETDVVPTAAIGNRVDSVAVSAQWARATVPLRDSTQIKRFSRNLQRWRNALLRVEECANGHHHGSEGFDFNTASRGASCRVSRPRGVARDR